MRVPTGSPEKWRGTEELGQETRGGSKRTRDGPPGWTRHLRRRDGVWGRERKERKTAVPEIPWATLADLHVEDGRRTPSSTRPRPPRRLRLSPQHSKGLNPPLPPGRRGRGATLRSPVKSPTPHRRSGAQEVTPPATSPAWPHCHSFPSLCLRLANHQAASVGTGIIDRRHQPIIARQGAVRALLKQATILNTAGARGAAAWGGAPAKAVGVPRDRPEGGG